MYTVDPPLPVEELQPGSYFVTGASLGGKDRLVRELLATGLEDGENALLVSTDRTVESVERSYADRLDEVPERFGLVDCVSERSGGVGDDRPQVSFASSPGDLTGIGMYSSRQLQRLQDLGESDRTRVALDSVSTLLMYADFETVVRFLHVLGGRLDVTRALGLFVLNTGSHEQRVVETILELADGVIEVRDDQQGTEVRVMSSGTTSEWRAF